MYVNVCFHSCFHSCSHDRAIRVRSSPIRLRGEGRSESDSRARPHIHSTVCCPLRGTSRKCVSPIVWIVEASCHTTHNEQLARCPALPCPALPCPAQPSPAQPAQLRCPVSSAGARLTAPWAVSVALGFRLSPHGRCWDYPYSKYAVDTS